MNKPAKSSAPKRPVAIVEDDAVPQGFQELNLDMPSVHWEEVSEISGVVIDSDMYLTPKANKRVLIVELDGTPTRLYEQPALRRLFDKVYCGDSIYVRTTGKRDLGGGHTLRTFKAGINLGSKRTPIVWPRMPSPVRPAARGVDAIEDDIPF